MEKTDHMCEYLVAGFRMRELAGYMIEQFTFEVGGLELSDEYCDTSSAMPQKKNPDVLEMMRGHWAGKGQCFLAIEGIEIFDDEIMCNECKLYVAVTYPILRNMIEKTEFYKDDSKEEVTKRFNSIKFRDINLKEINDSEKYGRIAGLSEESFKERLENYRKIKINGPPDNLASVMQFMIEKGEYKVGVKEI